MEPLRKFFGDKLNEVEFVAADLMNEESILNAIKGSDYVVHTASPVTIGGNA